jgi:hypothetical protein
MASKCERFRPLHNRRHVHCGNCRLWKANLDSYTNRKPLRQGETPCKGQ